MRSKKEKEYEVKDHQLSITYIHVWLKLLWQNKISPSKYPMIFRITLFVVLTQPFQWLQKILFHYKISRTDIHSTSPLFILGHWRSGTTHLHYILAKDKQFSYLNNYQSFLLNVSLIGRTWLKVLLSPLMPNKRPQDNVKLTVDSPAEEEQPLSNHTTKSGIHVFFFPKNVSYHDKYHLFKGIKPREKKKWKRDYTFLLKTISYVNGSKPLLLKNPHNTGRVNELLEIFPNGKFIFIHRNPYEIYQSMQHHYKKVLSTQFLQEFSEAEIHERILYIFETIMEKYLTERHLIPKQNLFEIAYHDLEAQPMKVIAEMYQNLNISNYKNAEKDIQVYLDTVKQYEKNNFNNLSASTINDINTRWKFAFETWNYGMI
jgi:hypothetical protein